MDLSKSPSLHHRVTHRAGTFSDLGGVVAMPPQDHMLLLSCPSKRLTAVRLRMLPFTSLPSPSVTLALIAEIAGVAVAFWGI